MFLMAVSFSVCAMLFFFLNELAGLRLSAYLESGQYMKQSASRAAEQLQTYVQKDQISVTDQAALESWVKKQLTITVLLRHDGLTLYDSSGHLTISEDF